MAERLSSKTDLWKLQFEFNEKLNSDLNEIQEMMNSMMDMIRGLNKSTSSQNFQSSSSSIAVARECAIPPLEAGIRVTDGAGQPSPLKMDTPRVEESIISLEELRRQIGADKVFEEMFLPNPIDTAENQGAENGKFQLQLKTNQQQWNTLDPWSESENENENGNKHLIVEEHEQNEGNNDNEGDVLSFGKMLSVLVLENEATVNGSANGSLEAWVKGVIRSMKVVWNQNVMWNDAHKVFDEMTPTFRAAVMNGQAMDPYISGINSNKLTLFDPGGDRNCVVSLSRVVVHPLITEAQETFVDGLKGVVSSLSHPLSIVAAKDGHCLIVFDHSHIFSVGSHAIFALILDSTVHGDDFTDIGLKASYEEANSELCMKIRSFYSGGGCLPHIGCDFSEFNRDQGDCCWITIMVDVDVKAGTWQMSYHVHDFIVNYTPAVQANIETSELLCKRDVDGSSCVELLTALCGYTLHNGRRKELCDEELQWKCGDQFRIKRGDMVTLLSSVYHNISSSPVCSGMNGNGHDSIPIQQLIAQSAGSMDKIQVWEVLVFNSTFDYLPSFNVTFSFNIRSRSKADCFTNMEVFDQIILKKGITPLFDEMFVRVLVKNGDDMLSVPSSAGNSFQSHLRSIQLPLNTLNLSHLDVNEELVGPLENVEQYFGGEGDVYGFSVGFRKARRKEGSLDLEVVGQNVLENETCKLFDKIPISTPDTNTPRLASAQTMELIKCKCKNPTLLTDNDVVSHFDPGGCTLSQMVGESFELFGEQRGLSLAFGLVPNVADQQVKTISHEPCNMNAYGCGVVIEYCGTKNEFVGEGSIQNAPLALCLIDKDYEGRKIDRALSRNGLDSFVVIRMEQRDYYGNDVEAEGFSEGTRGYVRHFLNALGEAAFGTSLHGLVAATLAARVTLKDNSRETEVLANMKSVCDWNNASAKVKGFPWGDVLYDVKALDSWRHFLDDIVLAAIFENFVWDPGLYMLL